MASILVTSPSHFLRGPSRKVYVAAAPTAYDFWSRYLKVFDRVSVAARVKTTEAEPEGLLQADGEGVEFVDLPYYVGPWQFLRIRRRLTARLRSAIDVHDAFCLRVPCVVGTSAWRELRRRGLPFGVEVVGDPWDSLGAGTVKSIARPVARRYIARSLRAQCRAATATAYVTRQGLQKRYPPSPGAFTTHYSSIELPADVVVEKPRPDLGAARRLIFVGALEVLYKGQDVLIRALARTGRPELSLCMVGDGRSRNELEALAESLGVAGQVTFAGRLAAGDAVRKALDAADLFVLPSRQEGLPRAMIEAMARGLPCIGSTVGGIPELLDAEDMVAPDDVDGLAGKILEFSADDPTRMKDAARRNLERSREYVADILNARRKQFLEVLLSTSAGAK